MKKLAFTTILALLLGVFSQYAEGQEFLRKIKRKTEDKVIDKMFEDDKNNSSTKNLQSSDRDRSNSPSNTRGGGLEDTAPDVLANISSAESSFSQKNYSDARFATRQAILGIELEIGQNILDDLPEAIAGLDVVSSEDQVTSSGIGFVGLIIQRVYRGNDQEFRVTVGNDAAMLSAANMYLASGAYATSSEDQNVKQTSFQDEQAVLEYNDHSGYQLSVPFGQSSILVANGVNFENETSFMNASEEVNLNDIKKQLGEQ
jgi:hypothetical protein